MQQIIMVTWVYYMSKIIDLLDTVIRKCHIICLIFENDLIYIYRCSSSSGKRITRSHFFMYTIMAVWCSLHLFILNFYQVNCGTNNFFFSQLLHNFCINCAKSFLSISRQPWYIARCYKCIRPRRHVQVRWIYFIFFILIQNYVVEIM